MSRELCSVFQLPAAMHLESRIVMKEFMLYAMTRTPAPGSAGPHTR